jgi:hypothetical protein
MMAYRTLVLAASLGATLLLVPGQARAQEIVFGGELRPRFEARHPVVRDWTTSDLRDFVSMRTRGSMMVTLPRDVRAFVQLQDVREWGADPNTMAVQAPGLDLHQGWIELGHEARASLSVRAGRQELAYGGERLIGAVNWAQQGRSFNGVRARVRPAAGVALDGLVMPIGDEDVGAPGSNAGLFGFYGVFDVAGGVDAYVLYNNQDARSNTTGTGPVVTARATDQVTAGGRWASELQGFTWRLEAALQRGTRQHRDVSAYLLAARVGHALGDRAGIDLWYDFLSGDDDPAHGTIRVFDTLFATNHKFYGFMDLFTNIPVHTAGRGLQDLAVKGHYQLRDDVRLGLDAHAFRLAATGGVETGRVGEELDLTVGWTYAPGVALTGGASYFLAGDAWSAVLGHPDRNMVWGYLMLGVRF